MCDQSGKMSQVGASNINRQATSGGVVGRLIRLVKKFTEDKSAIDAKYEASIRALNQWEKECERALAQKEEEVRNKYDSIDIGEVDMEDPAFHLMMQQHEQERLALDAEISRILGDDTKNETKRITKRR